MRMIDFPVPSFYKVRFRKQQGTFSVSYPDPVSAKHLFISGKRRERSARKFAIQILALGSVAIGHRCNACELITLDSGSEIQGMGFGFFGLVSFSVFSS